MPWFSSWSEVLTLILTILWLNMAVELPTTVRKERVNMGIWAQAGKPDFARVRNLSVDSTQRLREPEARSPGRCPAMDYSSTVDRSERTLGQDVGYVSFSQTKLGRPEHWALSLDGERAPWIAWKRWASLRPPCRAPELPGQQWHDLYLYRATNSLKRFWPGFNKSAKSHRVAKVLHKNSERRL
jgi:hypothetical protein